MDIGKANSQKNREINTYVTEYWNRLARKYSDDLPLIEKLITEIQRAYNSRKRYYHNLGHIHDLLQLSDRYRHHLREKDLVDFAIFYHDLVYFPLQSDNEEKSAARASKNLGRLHLPKERISIIAGYINASKKHELGERSNEDDLAWFLDFDMAVLGSDPESYFRYSTNVRLEYKVYPDEIYYGGRKKFLETTLLKPTIYHTPELRARYELQARTNLQGELAKLKST